MKVLEDTPAVLTLGKLCDEHGYSFEWINGQNPHLIGNGFRIQCNTENFVPIVVPGLSTSSSSSLLSSTSMTPSRQEIDHPTSSSSSSTSPTMTSSTVSSRTGRLVKFRHTGMAVRIQRLSRQFFSWTIFGAYAFEKCGFGSTQCLNSLSERPKLRDLPEDKNHKGPVQKTHWRSRTSCRIFWWLDYSRSQSSQWRLWISEQSSICRGGRRLSNPVVTILPV